MSGTTSTWVVDPAFRCVNYVAEEVKLASVLYHSVFAFGKLEPILMAARQQLRQARQSDVAINGLIDASKTLGQWARDVVQDDYHAISVHSLIGLWTTIEVAVEDTATLILLNDPTALGQVEAAGIRIRNRVPTPLTEAGARRVYTSFERLSRDGRNVAEAYSYLLSVLGITVTISPETATTLSELNYVRNCFLHRGGIVDERVASEAPDLGIRPGDKIRISESQSRKYLKGVGDFANALLQGALKSHHSPVPRS